LNGIILLLTVLFSLFSFASAQSSGYVRTPDGITIPEGTNINFYSFYTFNSNVSSINLDVDGNLSSCVDTANSDEQEIDIDLILPVGDYDSVVVNGYLSTNDCTGSTDSSDGILETGTPAFSVIPLTEVEVLQGISDNLESFLLIFLFFYLLFGIVKLWKS